MVHQLFLVLIGHRHVVVDHDCLEDGERNDALRSEVLVHVLQIFENHITESLFSLEELLSQSRHEA